MFRYYEIPPVLCSSLLPSQTSNAWGVSCAVTVARGANMKWARTFLAIGHTTDHANITRMLPDLQRPCKRSALHACKQPQIQRKAKRADVREKRSNPKRGKGKGKSCDIEHPPERKCADDQRKERKKGSRKKSCNCEHPLTKPLKPVVLAVVLLEKVSARMKCARPTLSSRHTRF